MPENRATVEERAMLTHFREQVRYQLHRPDARLSDEAITAAVRTVIDEVGFHSVTPAKVVQVLLR